MKRMGVILMLGVLVLGLTAAFCLRSQKDFMYSSWLWDAGIVSRPEELPAFSDFLSDSHFDRIYLQIDPAIDMAEYEVFIAALYQREIRVYALNGAPEWVYSEHRAELDDFLDWVERYQAGCTQEGRFAGIHADIEPQSLPEWETRQEFLILCMQETLSHMQNRSEELQLELTSDIPYWFDGCRYNNAYGAGNLMEWMITQIDRVTVMAYRDSSDEMIKSIAGTMSIAKRYDKEIEIAAEAGPVDEENVSFYGQPREAVREALEAMRRAYDQKMTLAIHHLGVYGKEAL